MHDVIIIGAGPAGLTAGLYSGRYRLKTLILEKMAVGGQILMSATIENYPGFPGGISTFELMEKIEKQVKETGTEIENAEVNEVEFNHSAPPRVFNVKAGDKNYQAKSLIISTGAHWKRLGIPGEEKFIGGGVSFCATCDAPFFRNKEVLVVGGGDKAIEEAVFLASYAAKVVIVHRRSQLRAAEIIQEKARANPKISFVLDSVVEELLGENKVEKVKIKNTATGLSSFIPCQGVFVFIGVAPSTEFLKNHLEMDESGFIITDNNARTSQDGVFACGDCRQKGFYQVITACGEGAQAAFSAHNYLLLGK
ncbi:MAG: thioredoxin-disulfide reductase [Candidatus Omnitrophota bacterium]